MQVWLTPRKKLIIWIILLICSTLQCRAEGRVYFFSTDVLFEVDKTTTDASKWADILRDESSGIGKQVERMVRSSLREEKIPAQQVKLFPFRVVDFQLSQLYKKRMMLGFISNSPDAFLPTLVVKSSFLSPESFPSRRYKGSAVQRMDLILKAHENNGRIREVKRLQQIDPSLFLRPSCISLLQPNFSNSIEDHIPPELLSQLNTMKQNDAAKMTDTVYRAFLKVVTEDGAIHEVDLGTMAPPYHAM